MSVTLSRRLASVGAAGALALSGMTMASADAASPSQVAPTSIATSNVQTVDDTARASCTVPRCYGAVSMSPDGAWGATYDYGGRRRAVRVAHRRCKRNSNYPGRCTRMGWVRNGCMAVAVRWRNGWISRWATGYGRTKRRAKIHAKAKLNYNAGIRTWLCTTRRY